MDTPTYTAMVRAEVWRRKLEECRWRVITTPVKLEPPAAGGPGYTRLVP
jgi:hypothetical protein